MTHFVANDLSEAETLPYEMIAIGDTISANVEDQRVLAKKVDIGTHAEMGTHAWMVVSMEEEKIFEALANADKVIYLWDRAKA